MIGDSPVLICSNALGRLGDQPITSLTDENTRARLCNRLYDKERRALSRAHRWNCAILRVALTQLSYTSVFGPTYKYGLPADCLRPLELDKHSIPYKIESGNLMTDSSTANLLYVIDLKDVTLMDACFVDALETRLAWKMAYSITGSREVEIEKAQEYKQSIAEARTMNSFESIPDAIESNSLINVRVGGQAGGFGKNVDDDGW